MRHNIDGKEASVMAKKSSWWQWVWPFKATQTSSPNRNKSYASDIELTNIEKLIENGEYEHALSMLDVSIAENPGVADWYILRGHVHRELNRIHHPEMAINDYTVAISLRSDFAEAYFFRGLAWHYNGGNPQYWNAIADYNKCLTENPKSLKALIERGHAHFEVNENAAAIEDYSAALSIEDNNVEALFGRAKALSIDGRHQDAIKDYDHVAASWPEHRADALLCKASVDRKLHNYAQALSDLTSAITCAKKMNDFRTLIKAYIDRGALHELLGDIPQSLRDYSDALKCPGNKDLAILAIRRLAQRL